jgi:cytochrome c peroxidase
MRKVLRTASLRPSPVGFSVSTVAFITFLLSGSLPPASAQTVDVIDSTQSRDWAPGAIDHAQKMRVFKDAAQGSQATPPIIPKLEVDADPTGSVATFQPGVATITTNNAFFRDLGTNGRTCFTCHQPQNGWTISAASARARFKESDGLEPLFRLVDGATCPTADISTLQLRQEAYKLLTDKGLIRIGIQMPVPLPPNVLEFAVTGVQDPYNCTTNPVTGLTSPTTGIVSMYRRPLPSTNLGFLTAIMWDGREPSLSNQSIDATLIHAQADTAPTAQQQAQIVAFETGIFTAQTSDNNANDLNDGGATGGPVALSLQLAKFFIGVNDPVGLNPTGKPFDPNIFDLYKPWLGLQGADSQSQYRRSVARGEEVFNTTQIKIKGVAGLNDVLNLSVINGFCGTCHDTPNVGNHSVKAPLNIGISNAGHDAPPALDISGLPVFTLQCFAGPLQGNKFFVTDIGRAMITGKCADIGKVKGPILRGLAARAPYFHNGSAATLMDAIEFYDRRFNIGLTDQQKQDLVNFLNTL